MSGFVSEHLFELVALVYVIYVYIMFFSFESLLEIVYNVVKSSL